MGLRSEFGLPLRDFSQYFSYRVLGSEPAHGEHTNSSPEVSRVPQRWQLPGTKRLRSAEKGFIRGEMPGAVLSVKLPTPITNYFNTHFPFLGEPILSNLPDFLSPAIILLMVLLDC